MKKLEIFGRTPAILSSNCTNARYKTERCVAFLIGNDCYQYGILNQKFCVADSQYSPSIFTVDDKFKSSHFSRKFGFNDCWLIRVPAELNNDFTAFVPSSQFSPPGFESLGTVLTQFRSSLSSTDTIDWADRRTFTEESFAMLDQ